MRHLEIKAERTLDPEPRRPKKPVDWLWSFLSIVLCFALLWFFSGCAMVKDLSRNSVELAADRDIDNARRVCRRNNTQLRWVTRSVEDVLRVECVNGTIVEVVQERHS